MSTNYAEKYSSNVDERFTLGSFTNSLVNGEYDWIGVETVKVYSIPTVGMNDYSLSGTSRYGTPSELGNEVQEMKVAKDRSFTFTIDRKSYDDTQMTMEAGKALSRQLNEVVIPEVDAYRIAALVAGSKVDHIVSGSVDKTTAYAAFLSVQEILDDAKVPTAGRICICKSKFHNLIKQDEAFTKKGDMATTIAINGMVGEVDGVPVVKVPASYFPSNVDFVITNPIAMPSPVKLQEYKIHTDAPGISGWLVEGRIRYDAFVLNEKAVAIGVHIAKTLSSIAITTAPTKTSYTSGQAFDPAGMVVTATYSDSTTAAVTGYTFSPATLTASGNVTITYKENGVTKTATQAVTVA
ncbi:MAG TPA: bacterial Ig-like domain-containing protein [Mobilitalea sp.]|nr:bacterial Ig-like domain-containing protein [Mobilitalea sp.]